VEQSAGGWSGRPVPRPKDSSCHDNWQWCAAREWRAEAPRQAQIGIVVLSVSCRERRGENLDVSPGIFTALTDTWFWITPATEALGWVSTSANTAAESQIWVHGFTAATSP